MCGICGWFRTGSGAAEVDDEISSAMSAALWRRGPDAKGSYQSPDGLCWLGHRRLAIVDLVTGDQPMANETGDVWTAFNGEIYNFEDLRRELASKGHRFRTNADTEVLVHGYEEWGIEGLSQRLRGIFAFAIYDEKARTLSLSRDHMGVKPLYWWSDGSTFLFASEIKSLLCHPGLAKREVSREGIAQFIVTRYVSRPDTMFKGVYKVPEASTLTVRFGEGVVEEPRKYWDIRYDASSALTFDEAVERLDELLHESVKMQLMSDVPLGAQLSGGVDSSVVVAIMDKIRREEGISDPVKTFSVGFDVERFSELPYARQIAERYGTEHHEIRVGFDDFIEEFVNLCWIYDEPVGEPPAIPTYLMCKKAKEHVTVMLCGEGADEQFGGYTKFAFDLYSRYLDFLPAGIRRGSLRTLARLLPFQARRLRSVFEILALSDPALRFSSWYGAFDADLQSDVLTKEMRETVGAAFVERYFRPLIEASGTKSRLKKFQYVDNHPRLVDDLLVKGDRMSMGASVEARVPFLDHHVVEFAATLPDSYHVKGMKTKRLLKRLAERYASEEIIYRRKVGFTVPLSTWFLGPLRQYVEELLLSDRCLERGYFQPDSVRRIVKDHLEGRVDREQGIWVLLALEIWHRLYVDQTGATTSGEVPGAEGIVRQS